jgi:hypothetical protein
MRKTFLSGLVFLSVAMMATSREPNNVQSATPQLGDFVNLQGLNESQPDWRILFQEVSATNGRLALHQSRWLMYFLHWRPLTEANEALTVDYVRKHMLNFWGQAMNFKLSNIDGEMEVCGHKAIFTEGAVMEGAVRTRFIVWNCPQTTRQFTADCNINLRRKTPPDLLDLQRAITLTVCCHDGCPRPQAAAGLTKKYRSDKWNVRFSLPPDWRTADYPSPEWFPQGMSARSGSLWTLLTDSQKHLELFWEETSAPPSENMFQSFMQKCLSPLTAENVTSQIATWNFGSLSEKRGLWVGEGTYEYRQKVQNQEVITPYRFQGFLWKERGKTYFLLAALVQIKEFWNISNDLSPSDERFQSFVGQEILPNIKGIPIGAFSAVKSYPQPVSEEPANFLRETEYLDFSHPVFQEVMDKILTQEMSLEKKLERIIAPTMFQNSG